MKTDSNPFTSILKRNKMWRILFWGIAGLLLYFVYSYSSYDSSILFFAVLALLVMSFSVSYIISNVLVPGYLFKGEISFTSIPKRNKLWCILFWGIAGLLLYFVFNNSSYDSTIRFFAVFAVLVMSFGVSYVISNVLVPGYLFKGKLFKFFYLLLFIVVVSVWINHLVIMGIILIMLYRSNAIQLPYRSDLNLLISGSYLIILFSTIIHFIKETYTRMLEKSNLEVQKSEAEMKFKDAKLKLLQGQLHPHFLFNMLNNIYGLWIENSKATPEVILKLSSLLDFMLYQCDKEKIQLEQEVTFIRNYVDLEVLRHDDRLKLHLDMPRGELHEEVSPLILFTFVENAFKHGANSMRTESFIDIQLTVSSSSLEFTVRNNHHSTVNSDSGMGLKNVKERLALLYPGKHALSVNDTDGVFSIILTLKLDQPA